MAFSLKEYIRKNYLNEALQSNILLNEIINDTGGFFRYYKGPYENSMYSRVLKLQNDMKDILWDLFGMYQQIDNPKINGVVADTDEKIRYIHTKYMKMYEKYIDMVSRIFTKTEPRIFTTLLRHVITDAYFSFNFSSSNDVFDMFNVTDDNFEEHRLYELRGNEEIKEELCRKVLNSFVVWIDHTGKIQAISSNGTILLFAPDNDNDKIIKNPGYKKEKTGSTYDIDRMVDIDTLKKNELTYSYKLSTGERLKFPTMVLNGKFTGKTGKETVGIEYIQKTLDLSNYVFNEYKKMYFIDKFYDSTKPLRALTDWGKNKNDKFIIYKPYQLYQDDTYISQVIAKDFEGNYTTRDMPEASAYYGYNEQKHLFNNNPVKRQQHFDFKDSQLKKYKWAKNIFDKFLPYAGGKQASIFSFGRSLSDDDRMYLYKGDTYCTSLANKNYNYYKYNAERLRKMRNIDNNLKSRLNILLSIVREAVFNGKQWTSLSKRYQGTDEYLEIMDAYNLYMRTTSYCLGQLGSIEKTLKDYIEKYIDNDESPNEKKRDEMLSNYDKIDKGIQDMENFIGQLDAVKSKINELTETNG